MVGSMIKGDKSPHVTTLERMLIPKHGNASTAKWIPFKQKTTGRCSKPENLLMNISERRNHPKEPDDEQQENVEDGFAATQSYAIRSVFDWFADSDATASITDQGKLLMDYEKH
uniref:Uncharacterized protein n=1 Tax=Daphnia galeata TaxID=27404 RepID=A0A8J2S0W6_9CRUS|nr:unnamed protein product [Daphnia galeata]